jgi:hypothetical protein
LLTGTATRSGAEAAGKRRSAVLVLASLVAVLAVSGCAPDGTAAAGAAQEFHQALTSSDWSSACSMLQSKTREEVAREQDSTCEDRFRALQVQPPGTVTRSEIYGRSAFIEFENDAVFLAAEEGGWHITAAECTPNGEEAPYTCEVGGK